MFQFYIYVYIYFPFFKKQIHASVHVTSYTRFVWSARASLNTVADDKASTKIRGNERLSDGRCRVCVWCSVVDGGVGGTLARCVLN